MLGEAQDVLLAAETSLARHHSNRRRSGRRPTEEVPHCLTCCCLENRQVSCNQRCTSNSSRRHSARRNTTVDELLRQMSFDTPILSDEETYVNAKNEVENGDGGVESSSSSTPLACPPSRCATAVARASSYCEVSKSPETTKGSSCERWPHVELLQDNTSQIRSAKSDNVERSEQQGMHSDRSKRKWPASDRKNSRRLQQLLGAGDRNAEPDEQPPTKASTTDADEDESSSETTIAEEAHIRELKLVRWQFIERIHDEVNKLHRLQRHLDGCCSPPLARRRSVSTMTSARLLTTESNVSGQF